MKTRVITGAAIFAVLVAVMCLANTPVYPIALSILAVIAVNEVLGVLSLKKQYFMAVPAYIIAAVMPTLAYVLCEIMDIREYKFIITLTVVLFVYMLYLFVVSVFERGRFTVADLSMGLVLITYITVSFSALSVIKYIGNIGFLCIGMVFMGAWVSDTFAYFTGMLFGKHKLIPEVSPKKTIEGSVGAVICTTIAFILFGAVVGAVSDYNPNYIVLGISGPILSVVGQIGDLFASLVKREKGVKDYGNLLPGHGGIMDRFDSILAVSGVTMVIVMLFPPFT